MARSQSQIAPIGCLWDVFEEYILCGDDIPTDPYKIGSGDLDRMVENLAAFLDQIQMILDCRIPTRKKGLGKGNLDTIIRMGLIIMHVTKKISGKK